MDIALILAISAIGIGFTLGIIFIILADIDDGKY